MSAATVSATAVSGKPAVSPIVSNGELLAKYPTKEALLAAVAAGTCSLDFAGIVLAALMSPVKAPPRVQARRTAKGTLWISLGYKAEKGKTSSATLPRVGWEAIIRLVQDGTIPGFLAQWDAIPLSASAQEGAA